MAAEMTCPTSPFTAKPRQLTATFLFRFELMQDRLGRVLVGFTLFVRLMVVPL